ncbi:DUF7501 family protein [Halomicrococcus sp. NG-SE-24]|uniref:DUF7501 family protein n=1 Tax=Halomicrococcus sp. NG-SE-24 TaxID=3436928 RepID=UPI003D9990BF
MSEKSHPDDVTTWNDPERCPFCNDELANAGPAFVDHLERNQSCKKRFETWRERVADDVGGEWVG